MESHSYRISIHQLFLPSGLRFWLLVPFETKGNQSDDLFVSDLILRNSSYFQALNVITRPAVGGPLHGLGPHGVVQICIALMASLDDLELMGGDPPMVVRLYEAIEQVASR